MLCGQPLERDHCVRKLARISIMLSLLALSGCATMSEDQCMLADWSQAGFQDGSKGYARTRLADHAKACSGYGVRPDANAYFAGRARGLEVYCTPLHGFEVGRKGEARSEACPPALAAAFLAGYNDGHSVYTAEYQLQSARDDLQKMHNRLKHIGEESAEILEQLDTGDAVDRDKLRERLQTLSNEREQIHKDMPRARHREREALLKVDRMHQWFERVYGYW